MSLDVKCIPPIVAESRVACEPVICVVAIFVKVALSPMLIASIFKVPTARLVIVAESKKALSAFIKSTDSCLMSPLSTLKFVACKVLLATLSKLAWSPVSCVAVSYTHLTLPTIVRV